MIVRRAIGAAIAAMFVAGCAAPTWGWSRADVLVARRENCRILLGDWRWHRDGPREADALLAQLPAVPPPAARFWFTRGRDRLAMCEYDVTGCSDRAEFFRRVDGAWQHEPDAAIETVCLRH